MNKFKILSYLTFLWKSKNEHGVHSPFVFDLVTKCLYDKTKDEDFAAIKKQLRLSKKERYKKKEIRMDGKIKILFRLVRYFMPENILTIGSGLEIANYCMQLGNKKAKIYSMESGDWVRGAENQKLDMVLIATKNIEITVLGILEDLLPTVKNTSFWILMDIHDNRNTENAWKLMQKQPKVRVSVDCFGFGLVFFRKEQAKEHFLIRV